MHLLVATPHYPPEPGGPGTYAKILADRFPALGVTVEIVCFASVRPFPKIMRPLFYLALILRSATRADIILALDPVSTGLPSAVAARLLKKPLVAKIVGDVAWERSHQIFGMDVSPDVFVRMKRVPLQIAIYRKIQEWVAACANRIIVPSHHLKTIVSAWGVPRDKIEVVYNSVEPVPIRALPEMVNSVRGFTIVTVARLVRLKNIDGVIAAVEQIPGANLIVIGDGPERKALEDLATHNPDIHFTGAVSHDEVMSILAKADVLVLNSSHEGLSHVLIEALIAGVPVVATRTGGNPEILAGESGLLVPVGDTTALTSQLQRLKDDPDLRQRLRRAAKSRAEVFSTTSMLQRTEAILAEVQSSA